MAAVPDWYNVTLRDRLFLVTQGVSYETAISLDKDEVLSIAQTFVGLSSNSWTHPSVRETPSREDLAISLKQICQPFVGMKHSKDNLLLIQDAVQDATYCECEASVAQLTFGHGIKVTVRTEPNWLYVWITSLNVTIHLS